MSDKIEAQIAAAIDNQNLANHPELIEHVFSIRGIKPYLDAFNARFDARVEQMKVDPKTIYHNKAHSYQVALNCLEGGMYSGCKTSELKTLLVAGLYHDADHSYGMHTDMVNVPKACKALCEDHKNIDPKYQLSETMLEKSLDLIDHSYFPYKVKKLPDPLIKVIRDADLMTILTSDKKLLLELMNGLHKEMNARNDHAYWDSKYVSKEQFIGKQLVFSYSVDWSSSWGKLKALKQNFLQKGKDVCAAMAANP